MKEFKVMNIPKISNIFTGNANRQSNNSDDKKKISIPAALGAVGGALVSVGVIGKLTKGKLTFDVFEQGSLPKDLGAVIAVSSSSILGGLFGGLLEAKSDEDKKAKVKESLFDISTVVIPSTIATSVLALANKAKVKSPLVQVAATVLGIGLGMPLAQKAVGVFDKFVHKDDPDVKLEQRKLKPQDYFVHVDDILALAIISKVPFAKQLHADKILPFIYAWCGFESGSTTANNKEENKVG